MRNGLCERERPHLSASNRSIVTYDVTVYIVTLTYVAELAEIDTALPDHSAWLDVNYADGVFLASGRQVPRAGGVILADGVTRDELERRLSLDPLNQRGLATYVVTEFSPWRTSPKLASLIPE